jgi:hypothetical protein
MLLVNGDPAKDSNLLANPEKNFLLIIKNGSIYKNTLPKSQKTVEITEWPGSGWSGVRTSKRQNREERECCHEIICPALPRCEA